MLFNGILGVRKALWVVEHKKGQLGLKTGFSHFTTHINMIEQLQHQQYIAFVIDG